MTTSISFGAFATVQYLGNIDSYVAANQGDLEGAIWARITSEPHDLGNGQSEFTMVHEFVCTDGSTISTTDVAHMTKIYGGNEASLTVQHTVVNATGRFAEKRGTFPSFGIANLKTGQGVQRFSGVLT